MARKFDLPVVGDEVRLSANFLRSLGTVGFARGIRGGGLTTHDRGVGKVIAAGESDGFLWVRWDEEPGIARLYNAHNLVKRADTHREAHHAEHSRSW